MICGGGATAVPDVATDDGTNSSWAMAVLLDAVLAACCRVVHVVILGQADVGTNRRRVARDKGDKETGRQGDSASAQQCRLRMSPCLPVSPVSLSPPLQRCHNWPPAGKVDAFKPEGVHACLLPHRLSAFPICRPKRRWRCLPTWNSRAVELPIHESGRGLKPSEVHADLERSARFCRDTHRLDIAALEHRAGARPRLLRRTSRRAASWPRRSRW